MFRSLPVILALLAAAPAAHAAQSYDNCTGFITSLPVTINTQGTWCMRTDLSSALTSGGVITVATNNVTLDCNHFKLGGLPAGPSSSAYGVLAVNRSNITVRNCTIRGFGVGVFLTGTQGGHLVEDNRADANLFIGLAVSGDGSIIRRNQVVDTGGSSTPRGLYAEHSVDLLDNIVSNVAADPATNYDAWGIYTIDNLSGRVVGNAVRGVAAAGTGTSRGMQHLGAGRLVIRNNDVVGTGGGAGVACDSTLPHAKDNLILGFGAGSGLIYCSDDGNTVSP